MTPIFIFSLPRSGSTLLQRMLAPHSEIATVSEPWLLLPFLYALKPRGTAAEYSHRASQVALCDFVAQLPGGAADYRAAAAQAALSLYRGVARNGERYFVDKTPRYHLVCEELIDMFPQGRFIFLWRNPLAVVASICTSFCQGRWKVRQYEIDTHRGIENLTGAYARLGERAIAVNFENLVESPAQELDRIGGYLGLEGLSAGAADGAAARLEGRLGDQIGSAAYQQVSTEPVGKWRETLVNSFRIKWCKDYLRHIGSRNLALMGYDQQELFASLDAVERRNLSVPLDLWHEAFSRAMNRVKRGVLG